MFKSLCRLITLIFDFMKLIPFDLLQTNFTIIHLSVPLQLTFDRFYYCCFIVFGFITDLTNTRSYFTFNRWAISLFTYYDIIRGLHINIGTLSDISYLLERADNLLHNVYCCICCFSFMTEYNLCIILLFIYRVKFIWNYNIRC